MRVVSETVPPTDDPARWERGLSPWHRDAFPVELADQALEQGDRQAGWYELDWCGNLIGWVPDGAVIENPREDA